MKITDSNLKWFEGEAEYECHISLGGFRIGKKIDWKEYYKDGKVMSIMHQKYLGKSVIIFDIAKQITYSKMFRSKAEIQKLSELPPEKVEEIDRNLVDINGYKCIKVVHSSNNGNVEIKSVQWVDESYAIPYLECRIAEVPTGLVVRSEDWVKTSKVNYSYKREIKEVKATEVPDSTFKL